MTQTAVIADVGAKDVDFTFAVSSSQKAPLGSEVSGKEHGVNTFTLIIYSSCHDSFFLVEARGQVVGLWAVGEAPDCALSRTGTPLGAVRNAHFQRDRIKRDQ